MSRIPDTLEPCPTKEQWLGTTTNKTTNNNEFEVAETCENYYLKMTNKRNKLCFLIRNNRQSARQDRLTKVSSQNKARSRFGNSKCGIGGGGLAEKLSFRM